MHPLIHLKAACTVALLLLPLAAFAQNDAGAKSETNPQTAVAATKVTFSTVPETDTRVKNAIPATDLAAAKKLIGKEATFTGTIARVFRPKSNSIIVLDFARNYRTAVTAAVQPKDFDAFPTLSALQGKRVLVTGKVITYRGQPEVSLTRPEQIKLIQQP